MRATAIGPSSSRLSFLSALLCLLPALSSEIDSEELAAPRILSAHARRALRATPLLSGLDGDALEAMVERIELVELDPGQILFREGDAGNTLYIVS